MKKIIKQLTQKFNKDEKGFTLIELIIVIAILAVIAAIAIPNIMGAVNNSRKTADVSNAKVIADAAALVQVKQEDLANVSGNFTIDGSNVTPSRANSLRNSFATALEDNLQGIPSPKYNGETVFTLVIDPDGKIEVYAGNRTSAAKQLYPEVGTDYQND